MIIYMQLFTILLLVTFCSFSFSYPDLMTCNRFPSMSFQNLKLMGSTSTSYSTNNNITIDGIVLENNIGTYLLGSRIMISLLIFDDDDEINAVFQANNGAMFEGNIGTRYHNGLIADCFNNNYHTSTTNHTNNTKYNFHQISRYQLYDQSPIVLQMPYTGEEIVTIECNYAAFDNDHDNDGNRTVSVTFPVTLHPVINRPDIITTTPLPSLSPSITALLETNSNNNHIMMDSKSILPTYSPTYSLSYSPSISKHIVAIPNSSTPTLTPTTIGYHLIQQCQLSQLNFEADHNHNEINSNNYHRGYFEVHQYLGNASLSQFQAVKGANESFIQAVQCALSMSNNHNSNNHNSNNPNNNNNNNNWTSFGRVNVTITSIETVESIHLQQFSSSAFKTSSSSSSMTLNPPQPRPHHHDHHHHFDVTNFVTKASESSKTEMLKQQHEQEEKEEEEEEEIGFMDDSYVHIHYVVEFLFQSVSTSATPTAATTATATTRQTITHTTHDSVNKHNNHNQLKLEKEEEKEVENEKEESYNNNDSNTNNTNNTNIFNNELKQLKIVYDILIQQLSDSIIDNTFIQIFQEYVSLQNGPSTTMKNDDDDDDDYSNITFIHDDYNYAYDNNQYINNTNNITDNNPTTDDNTATNNDDDTIILSFAFAQANILPIYFPPYVLAYAPTLRPTTTNNHTNNQMNNHHREDHDISLLSTSQFLSILIIIIGVIVGSVCCLCILLALYCIYGQYKQQKQKDCERWLNYNENRRNGNDIATATA